MTPRKFSLRSLLNKFRRRPAPAPAPAQPTRPTSARERVRSGIEPLEGRVAPAVLVNAHMLTYTDADGDLVKVKFSKDIFDLSAVTLPDNLKAVFKFTTGIAHMGAANVTDDAPQELQLIDLSAVSVKIIGGTIKSRVAGVSMKILAEPDLSLATPGDGFVRIGAIKAGSNALGTVIVDGDLGQIDAGVGTSKVGIAKLDVQSIGKFGTTTQVPVPTPTATNPAPDLESKITGELGELVVAHDMQGYIHVVDAVKTGNILKGHGGIGKVEIGGSLLGSAIVGSASDNTGRIDSSFDIGSVTIGATLTDGIIGGGGKNSGALTASHDIASVTISGGIAGSAPLGSGTISAGGKLGVTTIGGDLTGAGGVQSGSIRSGGKMDAITIGSAGSHGDVRDVRGGAGDSSGLIFSGAKMGAVQINGSISGSGAHSGGVFATGDLKSVTVVGGVTGGANLGSGSIQGAGNVGPVSVGGSVLGGDGAASGMIASGGKMKSVAIGENLTGGKGANSGAIFGGSDPSMAARDLGNITVSGALAGGDGVGSGAITSGGALTTVEIGALVNSGAAVQGGAGALSGAIIAGTTIASVKTFHGITGGGGAGSASIQAHGLIGSVSITGDLAGGTGAGSASIVSHEILAAAKPVPGDIGTVTISGKMLGVGDRSALVQADGRLTSVATDEIRGGAGSFSGAIVTGAGLVKDGTTSSITVTEAIKGGSGDHSGYIEIGGHLGSLTAGELDVAGVRVADDIASFNVNGSVTDSFITARGQQTLGASTDLAIGSVKIIGSVSNSRILAGYDVAGTPVNANAQIGAVNVDGNWTASTLAAGVTAGSDGLFGNADDRLIVGAHHGGIVSKIASIVIGGVVEGTDTGGDHFGFVAETIGAFSAGGVAKDLTSAPGQVFELGTHDDVAIREVVAV